MKNRNKFFEIIFAAAAVLFAGCSNSINPQEKSLPGTVIIKPVLPGQGARYVSPKLNSSNMIYYYYAKKVPSQTADNNSYSDNYSGFLEPANKSFPAALKNHGYNVGNTVKVADGEYVFNVLGYTVSTPQSITDVISDIQKLGNSNDQTQGQDLPSKFTVSGSVIVDCTNKTTVQVPMFWNGDYTGLGITTTTTTTVTSSYPNVKVVDALDFSYQFQSDDNSYANGNNGTVPDSTYDFCLKLTECNPQPNTEPIIVALKNTDDNGNGVNNLIVEEKQIESGVITTTVKINPACTEVITAGLWNIGFYKGGEIVSAYQYNTVMLVPGVKTTFNLDFNSNSPASSVFVKITGQSSETNSGYGTLLSPYTEFQYSLDDYHNTEVLLSNVEHNTTESFNESCTKRIVLDLNRFTLSAGIDIETSSAYPFTACNSTIKNGKVNAHLEMTNGGSLENVTFPVESATSNVISDANIISVEGSNAEDVTNYIVYSFKNVTADYIQIKNPGVIIDSLVNGTNNIKGIIIGEKGVNNLPTIAKSWRIGNPNTDFSNISLFKYEEDPEALADNTFKIVATTDYKIENGCIVYRPEPMGVISKDTMFNFCSLQGGNSIATSGTGSSYQINGFEASICAKTFDHNGYPWVLASYYDDTAQTVYYYILNQDSSVFCKIIDNSALITDVVMAADENYLYLCCGSNTLLRISYSDLLNKDYIIQNDAIQGFDLTGGEEEVIVSNFSLAAADNGDLYLLYKYDYYTLDENNNRLKVSLEKITKIYFDESGKLVVDTQSTKVLTGSDEEVLSKFFPVIEFSEKDFYYSYKNIWGEPDQNGTWPDHTGYQFHSDDSSLSAYGPSEKISINYSCYDMVYNNGKLYIPVDIKLDGLIEWFPVMVSTGNLVVYDIYRDNFEVKGSTINSNKLENLEIPQEVVNYYDYYDSDMEKPAETFKIVTYLPEPDQTQALMGAGKIIAIKDDQVIFVENGVFFEMDSDGKWKTSNNQGERIKYKHKQQAVIFTNNLFQRASVPTDYINYSNSGSTTIPVGYTLDCNNDVSCSSLHTLQYQFDVE